jgi:hypothetical protein
MESGWPYRFVPHVEGRAVVIRCLLRIVRVKRRNERTSSVQSAGGVVASRPSLYKEGALFGCEWDVKKQRYWQDLLNLLVETWISLSPRRPRFSSVIKTGGRCSRSKPSASAQVRRFPQCVMIWSENALCLKIQPMC